MNKKQLIVTWVVALLLSGCVSTKPHILSMEELFSIDKKLSAKPASDKPISNEFKRTLRYILATYFNESTSSEEGKEKMDVNIKGLWKDLGIPKEEISWKLEDGAREHTLFFDPRFDFEDTYLNYRVYGSGPATELFNEYSLLVLDKSEWEYQLLLFKKEKKDYAAKEIFISSVVIKDGAGYDIKPKFYKTKDNSLLFSTIEVGGRGTGVFSDYHTFYSLVDGKLKKVLQTLNSGYMTGWGQLFDREYKSIFIPYFFTAPDVGLTYYITYSGSSIYYESKTKDLPEIFELFRIRKDVYFKWDVTKKEFVLDRQRSQLNEEGIDGIYSDGEKEFYNKYKWRIQFLKFFGNSQQREWAGVFERRVLGKTEAVWNEQKGIYIEVPVKTKLTQKEILSPKDGVDYLRYISLQIGSVDIDMMYFLGWDYDNKKGMKQESEEAIYKLKEIKKTVNALNLSLESIQAKNYYLAYIDRMMKLYIGIENKTGKQIGDEYDEIRKFMDQNEVKINAPLAVKYILPEELPKGFDKQVEEVKGVKTKHDKDAYISAVKFIEEKKFSKAYDKLKKLLLEYESGPFEKSILLRISDCIMMSEPGVDLGTNDDAEKILAGIIDSGEYSPVLLESFEKWRSVFQSNNNGMSNMSTIPNDDYNKKRWEVVSVIKKHIGKHPDDIWAKEQVNALLSSPNIYRGTPFGNSNLLYFGFFYYDSFKEKGANTYKLSQLEYVGNEKYKVKKDDVLVYRVISEIQNGKGNAEIYDEATKSKVKVEQATTEKNERVLAKDEGLKYGFPLKVGLKWGCEREEKVDGKPRQDNLYCYYVEKIEDVVVPAGTFKNCFKIVYDTMPDTDTEWYHPGVGVVKRDYHHHGTIINITEELTEINKK